MEMLGNLLEAVRHYSANSAPIDFVLIAQHWELFLVGAKNTVTLVVLSLALGAAIALPLGIVRAYRPGKLNRAVGLYVYVFRGTPLLVQAYIIYYGLGQFEWIRESFAWTFLQSAWWCALIAFTLNTAAYQIEIYRGGFRSIPPGELEAAKALGMSQSQIYRRIAVPDALRRALPMILNEVIFMFHGSVVASTITVTDILGAGQTLNGKYYLAYEGFLAATIIYMIIIMMLTRIFRWVERKAAVPGANGGEGAGGGDVR